MTDDKAKLAALVGSRLCHDLISPIGAIQNGLELIALSGPGPAAPEMDLIQDSCDNASARIRFFRVAFGAAGESQMLGRSEVTSLLADLTKGGRVTVNWMPDGDLPRPEVQLAFLAYLCCEAALPQGGTISFDRTDGIWHISAQAPKLRIEPGVWQHLSGPTALDDVTPSRVQFVLLALLARAAGLDLLTQTNDTHIEIRIG